MFAIFKKELRGYFINPVGYVYTGIFLAASALICCMTTLQKASYETASYFQYMIFTFIILIPLLTMRSFSEERKMRTEQLLLTAPVSITGMVLGKYFAALVLLASTIIFSCINFFPLVSYAVVE
ncbi:MAG: ABC-2 transporter permease [Clostridia bacterium]|nr:ABC-2 transporter permease [Clostridia bacterium]